MIELCFNYAILRAYRVSSQSPKSKPLLNLRFGQKLELFKELKLLSSVQYKTLKEFSRKRNEIVHKIGGGMSFIKESEKDKIMMNALESALIARALARTPI
jgi:hypothetical protein